VVGFAQIPEEEAPVIEVDIGGKTAHILEQGLVWIDVKTAEILRIQSSLLAPRPDVGLEQQSTDVEFSAIRLSETPAPLRLPTHVVVDVTAFNNHIRDIHDYSDFKLFRSESRMVGAPYR
jgi:hypothetical protein